MSVRARLGVFALAAAATFGISYAAGNAIEPVGLSDAEPADHAVTSGWSDHGSHQDMAP